MARYPDALRSIRPRARSRSLPAVLTLTMLLSQTAFAHDDLHIQELFAGANGDRRIQFIVIERHGPNQNDWGPRGNESQSRAMLVAYDRAGRETGRHRFPGSPPDGPGSRTLLGTAVFADQPGLPVPDLIIPPLLNPIGGKICFRHNPANPEAALIEECVSYGGFSEEPGTNVRKNLDPTDAGAPAPALPITDAMSLRRNTDTGRNSDFVVTNSPAPANSRGQTGTVQAADLVRQGEHLFELETFDGNGRTCATCHPREASFRLSPDDVRARFEAIRATGTPDDPLFVGELAAAGFDDGFDFNLNTMVLTAGVSTPAPCTGELRGTVTDTGGTRARIVARTGPATYRVYGGMNPRLEGAVTDGTCTGNVLEVRPGNLAAAGGAGIEQPSHMRAPDGRYSNGRALIVENIDGFDRPPVLRRSPHLINLFDTAPYGLSGDFEDLRTFSTGAVVQHFPRSLSRRDDGSDPDFRLPTPRELEALEAFMLAQQFPPGDDPNKFDLARFATTAAQRKGREDFQVFGCESCHGGPTLSRTTVSIQGKPVDTNASFDTGSFDPSLPCEPDPGVAPCGSREFSTPQLFNLPSLGPYFHDGSAQTLAEAVGFYRSAAFGTSPASRTFIADGLSILPTAEIVRFLEGLVDRGYTFGPGPVRFGNHDPGSTATASVRLVNDRPEALGFDAMPCRLTGADQGSFRILDCPLDDPLAPGETREIRVAFEPTRDGLHTAILEVHPGETAGAGVALYGVGGAPGPRPELLTIAPASGDMNGGTRVTLSGAGFVEGMAVAIGGVDAGYVGVVSPTRIIARTGRHAAGPADIEIVGPDGQRTILPGGFVFEAAR